MVSRVRTEKIMRKVCFMLVLVLGGLSVGQSQQDVSAPRVCVTNVQGYDWVYPYSAWSPSQPGEELIGALQNQKLRHGGSMAVLTMSTTKRSNTDIEARRKKCDYVLMAYGERTKRVGEAARADTSDRETLIFQLRKTGDRKTLFDGHYEMEPSMRGSMYSHALRDMATQVAAKIDSLTAHP